MLVRNLYNLFECGLTSTTARLCDRHSTLSNGYLAVLFFNNSAWATIRAGLTLTFFAIRFSLDLQFAVWGKSRSMSSHCSLRKPYEIIRGYRHIENPPEIRSTSMVLGMSHWRTKIGCPYAAMKCRFYDVQLCSKINNLENVFYVLTTTRLLSATDVIANRKKNTLLCHFCQYNKILLKIIGTCLVLFEVATCRTF
ncbi:uncharacterized protein LOC128237320 [Mya arenaria]|uniref:uncharacterized protein LOC128237320 n=1 Tax=Mya arenaria TaxID=6604 RepID=UPI0022E4AFB4|nr:uncharacterized protein LOC128237320 [Mya arenaria]XP_052808684.1 uncharacterized protein LOC128237320 [Mya arenaria]XP_052808685.1 uncharacterized protein LOC128237320 [Mya arenaria]XP_052808686.1 uncharacterized protein LOC128237320 [Mya arenaria]XP_052808687.1 uncharacterized protein LOC128237320 [Mya arenaria]